MTKTETLVLENRVLKEQIRSARAAMEADRYPDALRCLDYEERLEEEKAKEECVWILTFQSGKLRSVHGTRAQAEEVAESLKPNDGDYTIT